MKKYIITTAFLVALLCHAQNLVPNGNLEGGSYNGGSAPIDYYSDENQGFFNNSSTPLRFDNDIADWYCAKSDKLYGGRRRDSPDWIDPNYWYNTDNEGNCTETRYVRCAYPNESIMVKLANGHKLIKGETYTFKVKARGGKGTAFPSHQFRLTFTADSKGDHIDSRNIEFDDTLKTATIDSSKRAKGGVFVLDTAKFRHSIDLRYIYDLTLGYNFSYHFLPKRLGVGVRAGMWYKKKENFPGGIYSRYGIKFSGDVYLDLTLWRSISLQMGVAFQNDLTWPSKENPLNDSGKINDWLVNIYLKPTFVFYRHYLISAGLSYSSFQPYKYYEIRPVVSIGYKF